uniref:Puratrophin-1 n=1 Tax=Leptobrachium leishanense TaxID=445787 RepID=A0A8C5QBU8_9ANUR
MQNSKPESRDLMIPSAEDATHQELEGDYVDLLDIASAAEHPPYVSSCQPEMGDTPKPPQINRDPVLNVASYKWVCGTGVSSEEGACTPCMNRKLNKNLNVKDTKCRFRRSYMAALKNPVSFCSAPADIPEDSARRDNSTTTFAALESPLCSRRKASTHTAASWLFPVKTEPKTGDLSGQGSSKNPKLIVSPGSDSSPSLTHRFSFLRGQRNSSSTGEGLAMDGGSNPHGGTWRRVSAVCSPRLSRTKFSGKGRVSMPHSALGFDVTSSVQKVPSKTGLWVSIVGSPARGTIPWETITDPPIQCQDLSAKLLYSGIACLPGSRDKQGRALIQVTTDSNAWEAPWCSAKEVARLLLYLCSVARKELRDLGILILVDARKQLPTSCLHTALQSVQASCHGSVQNILVLVEKDMASQMDRIPGLPVDVLTSLKGLSRCVEIGQLTWDLGGTFPYCHSEWVQFYQKLDSFVADLCKASDLLQRSIQELGEGSTPQDSNEAEEKMSQYRELMRMVLSDSRLVSLQREGGTTLARLRKEATRFYCSQDVRSAVESAIHMYNSLEEKVHALVSKSNRRLELLESLLKVRALESQFSQLISWMDDDGDNKLHQMDNMEWTLESLERYHKKFKEFHLQATVHYNHGLVLLDDANKFNGSLSPEMESFKAVRSGFHTRLTSFYMKVERQKEELEKLVNLYRFCNKISQLTANCGRYLEQLKKTENHYGQPETRQCLENFLQRLSREISADKFQEMKEESYTLSSCRGLTVWNETWLRCQEAKQLLEEALDKCRDDQSIHGPEWHQDNATGSAVRNQKEDLHVSCSADVSLPDKAGEEYKPRGAMRSAEATVINCCSFGLHAGSMGLFLKSSRNNRNGRAMEPLTPRIPWMRSPGSEATRDGGWSANVNFAKLHRIMEELLATERDYVCSLGYVLSQYVCEMERPDLPAPLRGQHAAVFGNLEKIYEFHSHSFLQELTSCRRDPANAGSCFLKHKERFGLYAFYSKNKPQSDQLLQDHGATFFKKKQQDLGDKMDLSSYLLKPIQRISKYGLLLQDMEWECKGQSARTEELKAAREVVRFQLRHGNDLLAMDAIQDCDVNLKEQGHLLHQGEFLISYRKRKCLRRLFLFQDLVLFSKTKKSPSGSEVYVYKQSFKTSEIGLTHTLGGSGLCFEIWFRRRKLEDTYTLQAPTADVKEAWTKDLERILWDQAIKNRELRKQERAFSGLGCKPFTDIQPSDAAISSRAVHGPAGEGDQNLCPSPAVVLPFQMSPLPPLRSMSVGSRSSASSAVSLGGCSSTSSGRGSLSPHLNYPGPETPWRCCRTEPPQERETRVFLSKSCHCRAMRVSTSLLP